MSNHLVHKAWLVTHSTTDKDITPGDSLKPGDIFNYTSQLCSKSTRFCLDFHQSGDPSITYLRISNSTTYTTIWIGNQNKPVVKNPGVLTLDHSGELKIVSQGKPIKLLFSSDPSNSNTMATLLDNGNFVLQQLHPNGSNTTLWKSFDYPASLLVPGIKLGVNHKTGHNWSLVSWMTYNNPASSDFKLEWEPRNCELIVRVRGLVCWKSGSYRDKEPLQNMPEEIHTIYDFSVISNEEEDSFTFTPQNKSDDKIAEYRWFLQDDGSMYDWQSGKSIIRADKCYGFNEDGGCQKLKNMSTCWNPIGKFVELVYGYINFTDNQNSKYVKNDTNSRLTKVDCWQKCWSDCRCVGFNTIYGNSTGCTLIYESEIVTTVEIDDDGGNYLYMLRGPLHHRGNWIWRGPIIAISGPLICLFIRRLALRKRKIILEEGKGKRTHAKILEFTSVNDLQDQINKGHDLRIFSYEDIKEVTNEFSPKNKLGEGGFGPMYKGLLSTGKEVAIKRLSKSSAQGIFEFKNELTLTCEVQHTSLVQLLGCCIHNEEMMLIYEYMPNKSLDFFLFDSSRGNLLDWGKRFNIIEGIVQGLLYHHKYSRLKVIHRYLKASNILLDEYMNPKISDFGMAKMFTQQESKINTNRIVGTYGYISPEYAMEGIFSTKFDVYSFGVLLLEIVNGKRNNSFYNDDGDGPLSLVGQAWDLWKKDVALQLKDPVIDDSCVKEEILRCIHIGMLCVEENADDRPTTSHIVSMLANKSTKLPLPKRPAILYV